MGTDLPIDSNYGLHNCTSILLLPDADGISLVPLRISVTAQKTCAIYTMLRAKVLYPYIHES